MKEISDYLAPVKARWKLVAGVTFAAMLLAALAMLPAPALLRTISVVGPDPAAQTANDRVDSIRNLQAAAETRAVLDAVSDESGVPSEQISDSLKVQRVGDSNLVRVTYESETSDPEAATAIVLLVPKEAIEFLNKTRIEEAAKRLDQAAQAVDTANLEVETIDSAIAQAIEDSNNVRPDVVLDALQSELAALRIRRVSTDATESPALAEQLTAAIAELESQVSEAAARANSFTALVASRETAVDERDAAVAEVESAQREYDKATALPQISLEDVEKEVSQDLAALRQIVAIGVATLVLVIALIIAAHLVVDRSDATTTSSADDRRRGGGSLPADGDVPTSAAGKRGT